MNNEIRLGSFSILTELGPMSIGFRSPDGQFVNQQVIDIPAVVELPDLPAHVKGKYGIRSIEIMDTHLFGPPADARAALREAMAAEDVAMPIVLVSRYVAEPDDSYREQDLAAIEQLI